MKKSHEISYDFMVNWLKTAGGKSINAMMIHEEGDIYKVFSEIQRQLGSGIPETSGSKCNAY